MIDEATKEIIGKTKYLYPKKYIAGRITQYDIKAANISVLYTYGVISDKIYRDLLAEEKIYREIDIGNMIRDDYRIYETIKKGIREYKYKLADANNINANEIIRVANDAVYINKSYDLNYTDFDNIHFINKGTYNSMLQLPHELLIFSFYDRNGNINIETKGLGDSESLHQNYMLSVIGTCLYILETVSIEDALKYITQFYEQYINRALPIKYYRELNSESFYSIINSNYKVMSVDQNNIPLIDISYNLNIIRELYSIIFELYSDKIRTAIKRRW